MNRKRLVKIIEEEISQILSEQEYISRAFDAQAGMDPEKFKATAEMLPTYLKIAKGDKALAKQIQMEVYSLAVTNDLGPDKIRKFTPSASGAVVSAARKSLEAEKQKAKTQKPARSPDVTFTQAQMSNFPDLLKNAVAGYRMFPEDPKSLANLKSTAIQAIKSKQLEKQAVKDIFKLAIDLENKEAMSKINSILNLK